MTTQHKSYPTVTVPWQHSNMTPWQHNTRAILLSQYH